MNKELKTKMELEVLKVKIGINSQMVEEGVWKKTDSPQMHDYYLNELNQISKLGIAIVAFDYIDAVNKLNHLLNNDELSRSMSNKAKSIFSKNGSNTFLELLKKLIKNKWQMDF